MSTSVIVGASVCIVLFGVIAALAAVVVADNTNKDNSRKQRYQNILGCSGAVLGLSAVGFVLAITALAMQAPVRGRMSSISSPRSFQMSSLGGSLSSSGLFRSSSTSFS